MKNFFADWTPEMVAAHNARVTKRPTLAVPLPQAVAVIVPAKKRVQNGKPKITKLEADFFALIKDQFPNYPRPRQQAKTYLLSPGCRYTPDISVSEWPDINPDGTTHGPRRETCWEVKGPWATDDSIVKIKMAPTIWPEVNWWLVWRDKATGAWQYQRMLP